MAENNIKSKRTTDHDVIRKWVEKWQGRPAVIRSTWDGSSGLLRLDFGEEDKELEEISLDDFFHIFDENDLAFLYQEETFDGETSRFFKFVEKEEGRVMNEVYREIIDILEIYSISGGRCSERRTVVFCF